MFILNFLWRIHDEGNSRQSFSMYCCHVFTLAVISEEMMWCVFTVHTDMTISQHIGVYKLFALVPDCIVSLVSSLKGIFLCTFQLG